ncbi:GreA/GreB family elongation factor [bacterium]|nr:GreA/GreB family elongation factor [bacterium]
MIQSNLQVLVEEEKYDELEDRWLDQMTSGQLGVEESLYIARLLGRNKEKERAGLLLGLLADHFREKENWTGRFRVLAEIARHSADPKKVEDLKDQIEESLKRLYPDAPSFSQILHHFHFHEIRTPDEIKPCLDKVQQWLSHDIGRLFYEPGRGVGKVREINLNLGFVRIDFENRKDVAVDVADSDLLALLKGHILREKMEQPDALRERLLELPERSLGELLQQMARPMSVSEIKDCFSIVPENRWAKWWTSAKKNPQVLVEGKGAQATFSWISSSELADESIKKAFGEANPKMRLELVKQHASRSSELKAFFEEQLHHIAKSSWSNQDWPVALDLLDLISKSSLHADVGYTFEGVLGAAESRSLLSQIENANLKLRILEGYKRIYPDRFREIFSYALLHEENPRILSYAYETLQNESPRELENLLDQALRMPHSHPGIFSWMCQKGEVEGMDLLNDPIGRRLDGKFLTTLLSVLDDPELSGHRNRIKKALENGLLINILGSNVDQDTAGRAIDILEHSSSIEDYRRDRWKNVVRMRFPEFKRKEEWVFSTKEATEKKRLELEHLVKVELPTNRKAVGEAAALGDLSENHEYKAARERQEYLINRVQQLQNDLGRVRILEPGKADTSEVRPGTCVTLLQNSQKVVVTILGPWDSNPKENIFSYQSPIGINLIGKSPGDQVQWNDTVWIIERIDPW